MLLFLQSVNSQLHQQTHPVYREVYGSVNSNPPPSARTLDGIQQVVGPHHGAFACKGLSPGGEEFDNLVKNKELCISKLFVNTQACVIGHQRG